MTRIISRGDTYGASLSTTTSVAVFEGAQIKIFESDFDPFALRVWRMDSTSVTVFPVPCGDNNCWVIHHQRLLQQNIKATSHNSYLPADRKSDTEQDEQ